MKGLVQSLLETTHTEIVELTRRPDKYTRARVKIALAWINKDHPTFRFCAEYLRQNPEYMAKEILKIYKKWT